MNFGDALHALKGGARIRRATWPAGYWMILVPGSSFTVEQGRPLGDAIPSLVGHAAQYRPHIDMCVHSADTATLGPAYWLDQDILADDWEPVT